MNTSLVTLDDMLAARELRRDIQAQLTEKWNLPLLSFSMNIAGSVKTDALTEFVFADVLETLHSQMGAPVYAAVVRHRTGCQAIEVFDADENDLKACCIQLEDNLDAGRLCDLDVISSAGSKLSRSQERKCLICDAPAFECARSRRHNLEQLRDKTEKILSAAAAKIIGQYAYEALLYEAHLSPKPGLVDSLNCGAHSDMDLKLMEKSAESLKPYFIQLAHLGLSGNGDSDTFRKVGVDAEAAMLEATHGVNTHKGAIYVLGLLTVGFAGELLGKGDCFRIAASLASAINPSGKSGSHGEYVKKKYSAGGARAEALSGFPNVCRALEILSNRGDSLDVLLFLLAELEDTNVLWRSGIEGLNFVHRSASRILAQPRCNREELLRQANAEFVSRNISPGGSADLLAAAIFVQKLRNYTSIPTSWVNVQP